MSENNRLRRALMEKLPVKGGPPVAMDEFESHHVTRVLRLSEGDEVELLDAQGRAVVGKLERHGKHVLARFERDATSAERARVVPFTLEVAAIKGEAMEWLIEKATEAGVGELVPLLTDYSVIQIKHKGPEAFKERWQKIADQALKQCGRLTRLVIHEPVPVAQHLARPMRPGEERLWLDEAADHDALLWNALQKLPSQLEPLRACVGPEGGWSPQERELLSRAPQTQRVSMGAWVLRAETAALEVSALCVQRALTLMR